MFRSITPLPSARRVLRDQNWQGVRARRGQYSDYEY
jgi:hypothetical protein